VIDKTGLTGSYDYNMELPREEFPGPVIEGSAGAAMGAAVFSELERQLGAQGRGLPWTFW
jgi:uncharacterized protein (TIGR03435 family)